jgi:MFS superfamily sulfate permease-like transporter
VAETTTRAERTGRGTRHGDVVAGLAIAGLLLPEAVAYAGIAGLPPQHALVAAIAGCCVYGLLGQSRFAVVAPTSSSAAILAAALANLPEASVERGSLAVLVTGLTGLAFLIGSLARLGGLTGFVSRPVLKGFAFGLAVIIILRQLPSLLGFATEARTPFGLVQAMAGAAGSAHLASIATGLAALVALLALRRRPAFPSAFTVLAGGIAASWALDLPSHGVAVVGPLSLVLTAPAIPSLSDTALSHLVQLTLPLVLILFAESWGTIRTLALRHGDPLDPDRELRALGLANMASMALNGMPVGAGFSAGVVAESAGARTRRAAILGGIGLFALILVGLGSMAWLPRPVLAAIVIAALAHALDPSPFLRLWRLDRDRLLGPAAAAAVILLGIVNGMLVAIGLSLAVLLRRLASPVVVALGRLDNGHAFVDRARHPDATVPAGLIILRPAEPLFFGNADRVLGEVVRMARREKGARAVVLSLEESFDFDSSALDALIEAEAHLTEARLPLHLARTRDVIRDLIRAAGAKRLADRCGYSVDDAVAMALADLPDGAPEDGPAGPPDGVSAGAS